VLPLDFRTAYLEDGKKVIIQAKPLEYREEEEEEVRPKKEALDMNID